MPAIPLSVLNIFTDSILHVSASDTAVRCRLLPGLPPLLTILLLTKFALVQTYCYLSVVSIMELSIRPLVNNNVFSLVLYGYLLVFDL